MTILIWIAAYLLIATFIVSFVGFGKGESKYWNYDRIIQMAFADYTKLQGRVSPE